MIFCNESKDNNLNLKDRFTPQKIRLMSNGTDHIFKY